MTQKKKKETVKETVKKIVKKMTTPRVKKKEIVKEIQGDLVFVRDNQDGSAVFGTIGPYILSNERVLIKNALPPEYKPEKHSVSGLFTYRIVTKEK